ncbi:MAG: M55 family metallopeptidase [Gemmatimonadetes bacterium]|nr:M55 family metallopeptidase [Gemmatimonadota bacterium]
MERTSVGGEQRSDRRHGARIYISADMEGVAGVVTGEQLGPSGFEYQRFRDFMTEEVLAAIEGLKEAGATEFVVSDSHGNGQNLLIERLPPEARLVRSWPRPLMMMEGIDETFDAVVFLGYHTGSTNPSGVRAHTMSSARLTGVRINGVEVSEAAISAAIAGHFGVPVVMVTGDNATVEETRGLLGDIKGVAVKEAIGFHSAISVTPLAARDLIREGARAALGRVSEFQPYCATTPVQLEIAFKHYRPAEVLALLPDVERVSARTIRTTWSDILGASKFLQFVLSYEPGLEP